jgi:tRNA(Ile)-lysidine synthase
MLKEFEQYLKDTCGCTADKKYLLAVSGGIDSTIMAALFHLSGADFALAHCNFHLRGVESDDDQRFVENLATGFHRPCFVKNFDTSGYSANQGISVQMAARDLRYEWFNELADQNGFDFIATGHNRNDVVETLLLNLSRGTGIRGLSGISPRHGKIIRPLLFASRDAIITFAKDNNLAWREDSSNAETKYHRNKIRHVIIPAFETLNPSFIQNTLDTAHRFDETEKFLDFALRQVRQDICTIQPDRNLIDIKKLQQYPVVDFLLFELMREFGVNPAGIQSIIRSLGSTPGKQFFTRTHCITRDRSHFIITPGTTHAEDEAIIGQDTAHINHPVCLNFNLIEPNQPFRIPEESCFAALDADLVKFPLKLRRWKAGDRFHPLGLKGSKKISDFLINIKIPLPDKKQVWILESENKIAWVVNYRIDNRFKITAGTRKILLVEYAGS